MRTLLSTLLLVGVFFGAMWLTGWFRRYALTRRVLDIPNPRSSHAVATPRGAGLAIVLPTVIALPVLVALGVLDWPAVWALAGGSVPVSLIGFADDRRHIAASWRLLAHVAAAAWVLVWLGGMPRLPVLGFVLNLGWLGHALAVLYVVWLLNLTNFMDGIDGIASVEASTVSLGGALLYLVAVQGRTPWFVPVVLAAATLGFMVWNWPPAKVFMGDAGSGFLGLMLAALSLQAAWVAPRLFWGWVILLGAFVVDATVTLISRMARGEKFYEPHRSHAYQHAAHRWRGHLPVTLAVGAINLCWLLPIALLVATGSLDGLLGVFLAYAPLVAATLWLKAGRDATYLLPRSSA